MLIGYARHLEDRRLVRQRDALWTVGVDDAANPPTTTSLPASATTSRDPTVVYEPGKGEATCSVVRLVAWKQGHVLAASEEVEGDDGFESR